MAALNSLVYLLLTSTLTIPPEKAVTTEVNQNEIDPRCPPNEEYRKCDNTVCILECVCKAGFVRGRHGSCVKPQKILTSSDEQKFQSGVDPDINGGCPDIDACFDHCGPKMGICMFPDICVCF
ncbi:hypothetical protein HNY73_015858 [Argiope bruennichi]|uniref:TIL domain-containing protein n=1 Tax=Argiope bruennichi TaxID=94029 RepID=A0A8T0EHX7_ARGBR|nr:hypothetical protein HNY73_015858 [Argiope bruennichi]